MGQDIAQVVRNTGEMMRSAEQVADGKDNVLCVCSNCERKWIMLITKQVRQGQLNAVRSRDAEFVVFIERVLANGVLEQLRLLEKCLKELKKGVKR